MAHSASPCGVCDASAFVVDDGLSALRASLFAGSNSSHAQSAELLAHYSGQGRSSRRDSGRASTRAEGESDEQVEETGARYSLAAHLRARFPTATGILVSTVPSHSEPTSEPPVRVTCCFASSVAFVTLHS